MVLVARVIELIAIAVAVAAGIVAWRNWRRTHGESEGSALRSSEVRAR